MIPANLRPAIVDAASPPLEQVLARGIYEQEPAILILVGLDVLVGKLPKQDIEITLRAWRVDLLGDVSAAFGIVAETAFRFRRGLFIVLGRDVIKCR